MALFPAIDQAIANFEGYGQADVIPTRGNNPGDITWGQLAVANGAIGKVGTSSIAQFPDTASGLAAEDANVAANSGLSISQLINKWAPGNAPGNTPDATANFVNYVSGQLGVDPSTPVSDTQNIPAKAGTLNLNPTATPATSPLTQSLKNFGTAISMGTGIGAAASTVGGAASTLSSISWSRVAAFVLGLIAIAAGLYMFKPSQSIITRAGVL